MVSEKNQRIIDLLHKNDAWDYQSLEYLINTAINIINCNEEIDTAIEEVKFVRDKASRLSRKDFCAKGIYYRALLL